MMGGFFLVYQYPFFDMADELFHFDYVFKLSKGHGLIDVYKEPIEDEVFDFAVDVGHWKKEGIVTPESKGAVSSKMLESIRRWGWYDVEIAGGHSYEGVQPPLYYGVASVPVAFLGSMVSKVVAARLVSVVFSTLALVGMFFVLFKASKSSFVSLGAVLLLTATPAWRFESFRIGNDVASKAMIVLVILVFFLLLERNLEGRMKGAILLGLAAGLAALTRLDAAIALGPMLMSCYLFLSRESLETRIRSFLVVVVVAVAVSGWFYIRNMMLYGDFSGAQAIIGAVYIDKDLDKAPNMFAASLALLRFSSFFVFSPYLDRYGIGFLRVAGALWLMGLSFLVTSLIILFLPRFRKRLAFLVPIGYLLFLFVAGSMDLVRVLLALPLFLITLTKDTGPKPRRSTLLLLFLISTVAVGFGSIYYLTYVGPISERYLLGAAPFGAAMMVYGIHSTVIPGARKAFLGTMVLMFTIASITQQTGQIDWLMANLSR